MTPLGRSAALLALPLMLALTSCTSGSSSGQCAAPEVAVASSEFAPGTVIHVTAQYLSATCNDTGQGPDEPAVGVPVSLVPAEGPVVKLGSFDADENFHAEGDFRVPDSVGLGKAELTVGTLASELYASVEVTTEAGDDPAPALSVSEVRIATDVAQQEAAGLSPDNPGIVQPIESDSWPSYVTNVEAIAGLTRADAGKYTESSNGDDTPVIVVRMTGEFAAMGSAPSGESPVVTGTTVVAVADAENGQVLDFGISADGNIPPLPNPQVIYSRD